MRSPLPFPCVPDRPYKILLAQVGTLSFSHPSFGVPVLFIYLYRWPARGRASGEQVSKAASTLNGHETHPTTLKDHRPVDDTLPDARR